jgi:hypothetical protein
MNSKFLVVFLLLSTVAFAHSTYTVVVADGNAFVAAEFEDSASVPLPLDASDLVVTGGLYTATDTGIDLEVQAGGAGIAFTSSLLVINNQFILDLPLNTESVVVSFPEGIAVSSTNPAAQVSGTDVTWTSPGTSVSATLSSPVSTQDNTMLYAAGVIVIIILLYFFVFKK